MDRRRRQFRWAPEVLPDSWDGMTAEQRLGKVHPLVEIMAAQRTGSNPNAFDDASQEGLIAAWHVITTMPEKPREYVTMVARNAIIGVLRGRPLTGGTNGKGTRRDPLTYSSRLTWSEEDAEDHNVALADVQAAQQLLKAEMAQHEREIDRAVRDLPESYQRIIRLRFWEDMTYQQIADLLGVTKAAPRLQWSLRIQPALSERLRHLQSAAAVWSGDIAA